MGASKEFSHVEVLPRRTAVEAFQIITTAIIHQTRTTVSTLTETEPGKLDRVHTDLDLLHGPDATDARLALAQEMMSCHAVITKRREA